MSFAPPVCLKKLCLAYIPSQSCSELRSCSLAFFVEWHIHFSPPLRLWGRFGLNPDLHRPVHIAQAGYLQRSLWLTARSVSTAFSNVELRKQICYKWSMSQACASLFLVVQGLLGNIESGWFCLSYDCQPNCTNTPSMLSTSDLCSGTHTKVCE